MESPGLCSIILLRAGNSFHVALLQLFIGKSDAFGTENEARPRPALLPALDARAGAQATLILVCQLPVNPRQYVSKITHFNGEPLHCRSVSRFGLRLFAHLAKSDHNREGLQQSVAKILNSAII